MINKTANPVELAVAAAFVSGQVNAGSVQTYAKEIAQTLGVEGIDTTGWESAVQKWSGAAQTFEWRTQAQELITANKDLLSGLAQQIEQIARIPAAGVASAHPAALTDWLFQQGCDADGHKLKASAIVSDPAFFDKGRFAAYPNGTSPPASIDVGQKRNADFPIPVDTSLLGDPKAAGLAKAMTTVWDFIQNRGVEGGENINTLTRHSYNQYGVQQILQNLEERGVQEGRVLLVTGYETPIEDLLESDRIKEVLVADLSENAAQVIADKYKNHPNARKLKVKLADFSGIDLDQQAKAAQVFGQHKPGEVPPEVTKEYFANLDQHQTKVDFDSDQFDAVHLPFLAGSLHLGPITQAIAEKNNGWLGYDDYLGAENLATPEAADAALSTMRHAFDEALRIAKKDGLVVTNLWARPQPDSKEEPIRLSDTPITTDAFDRLMNGMEHQFSGNPQPGLPHTVGHIFTATK